MREKLTLRNGVRKDYPSLLEAERVAWRGSGVSLITEAQFQAWIEVFPEGLIIAEQGGEVCGHLFSQICEFDPYDASDNRNWDVMTDSGYARRTHIFSGSTLYAVSISACVAGAGKALLLRAVEQTRKYQLPYYAGACRMPGLTAFAKAQAQPIDAIVEQYAEAVRQGIRRRSGGSRVVDPTLSVILSVKGAEFFRLIPKYFSDTQSGNWAALVVYQNN